MKAEPDCNATAQAVRPSAPSDCNATAQAVRPSNRAAAPLSPAQRASSTANHTGAPLALSTGHPDSPLWDQLSWRIAGASQIDILASFVQLSGLDVIEERLFDALRNGACIRILVSDYLCISDAKALGRLVGWCELARESFGAQRLQARLIEIAKLPSGPASFHPKAWHIVEG